ncbi:restriction endonuclease subunit S [Vibrio sp. Vb1337]|uniref:restriction endonuclease subunit S n=1 Tax=Vibrio sp. Vb1337 TaxID=3074641 RepID=UPI00296472DE|nr:restriction endonuclease subunit S [Vibrio sp. Vb1337]MDW1898722.1 restriction endonuclease subunit S [Vibrio sp. Vb1337]
MRFKTDELTTYVSRGIAPKYTDIIDGAAIVVNQKCIRDYQVNLELARLNDLSKRKVPTEKLVQKYDVLVNSTGVGTLGRVGQFLGNEANLTVDTHVTIVRPDKDVIDPLFFGYLMKSKQRLIESFATGTTGQTELSRDSIKEMEVSFVENREHQQAIGNFLLAIDRKLQLNKATNQTLEQMAQAIFKSWFVDFDPVKAKMNGEQPEGMDEATASLFPEKLVESELGLIPEGWEVSSLSELIKLTGGGTPKRSEETYWGGDIPWFSVKDVPSGSNVFVVDTDEKITELGLNKSSTKLLPKGTTIITARGTVGKLALVGTDMCMNQSCYGIRGKEVGDYYNYFNLKQAVSTLQQNTHGAVFDTITTKTFDTYSLAFGGVELADKFDALIAPLLQKIEANVRQNIELSTLRDTLLPKLLSGEIELGQAQELAEVE